MDKSKPNRGLFFLKLTPFEADVVRSILEEYVAANQLQTVEPKKTLTKAERQAAKAIEIAKQLEGIE